MRKISVFYAWQDDTERRFNRHLIRMAFEMAASRINADIALGVNVRIDADTEGVPGWAPITQTILDKIDQCDIFAPDLTFVATTAGGKLIPNPNVMFESGYTLKARTYKAMMPIMNTAFGPPEKLPFDMGHLRHPITYYIEPTAKNAERRAVRARLSEEVEQKLRLQIAATQPPAPPPIPFPQAAPKNGPARFRAGGEAIGRRWGMLPFGAGAENEIFLADGPAIWLRLFPTVDPGRTWAGQELKDHAIRTGSMNLSPFVSYNIYMLRSADGIAICPLQTPDAPETTSVAFVFETGEIWSVDTTFLTYDPGGIPYLEPEFLKRFQDYVRLLSSLGLNPPYQWIGGMTGVKDRRLQIPIASGEMRVVGSRSPLCLSDTITAQGAYDGQQTPASSLLPLFKAIFDKCSVPRPAYLPR